MIRVEHIAFPGRVGTVWVREGSDGSAGAYEDAKNLKLTLDGQLLPGSDYRMIAWDDRPGVLEARYVSEFRVLPEPPPPPEPTVRDVLLDKAVEAMWTVLRDTQDELCMGACVDPKEGLIDGRGIDLRPAADAVFRVIDEYMTEAVMKVVSFYG